MKIALLTEIINLKSGSRAPLEIAKSLSSSQRTRNQVTVFAYAKNLEKDALSIVEHKIFKTKNFLTIFKVAKELKNGNFDIISFHGTLLFFLGAKLSGIPIIRTYYGTQFDAYLEHIFPDKPNYIQKIFNKLLNQAIYLQEKLMLSLSSKIIAISKYTQKELLQRYCLKTDFVYLGSPIIKSTIYNLQPKTYLNILSVSRIVPYKGFHHLIAIFNKLNRKYPNIRLTIIGSTPNRKYLKYLKSKANKNITFIINASENELLTTYRKSDIYATFDNYMFFGMPILEAAIFSLPAIAIARCAAPEIIRNNETGYLAKNKAEFGKYLEKLIINKKLRIQMGQKALEYAKIFSWKNLGYKYARIFKEIKQ